MGWRFRRSVKILPGIHLNLSKRGLSSLSFGRRGATLNVGRSGVRETLGIPGTGISYSSRIAAPHSSRTGVSRVEPVRALPAPTDEILDLEPSRFGLARRHVDFRYTAAKTLFLVASVVTFPLLLALDSGWAALPVACLALAWLFPSTGRLRAAANRQYQVLAHAELDRRRAEFHDAIGRLETIGKPARSMIELQERLGLTHDEIARDLETIRAHTLLERYVEQVRSNDDQLPAVDTPGITISPGVCFFSSKAVFDRRGSNDPEGCLLLTKDALMFVAPEGLTTVGWERVLLVERDDCVLRVQRQDRQTPYLFELPALSDAFKATFVARRVLGAASSAVVGDSHTAQEASTLSKGSSREPELAKPEDRAIDVGTGHGVTLGIVGESYRQTALRTLAGSRLKTGQQVTFTAVLRPEPQNPHDANAVKVETMDGSHLGYLSREDAGAYRDALTAIANTGAIATCNAKLIGGTEDKPSIGVMIDVRPPDELIANLSNTQPF
jgi:hypothetical protein